MNEPRISVFLLARNEEKRIAAALDSVAWTDERVVIDSFSTDRTAEIAEGRGAKVVQEPFEGFGRLRQRGIAHTQFPWILSLDCDERCTEAARDEILRIAADPASADAYLIPRENVLLGRPVRHGGWYPDYRQPQLFRRGRLEYVESDLVHEGYRLNGRLGRLRNPIVQIPYANLSEAIAKLDRYTTLAAEQLRRKGKCPSLARAASHGLWAFLKSYLFQRGFLDGSAGFAVAFLRLENSLYKHLKLIERPPPP